MHHEDESDNPLREANALLARANAEAAEVVAELEERSEQLRSSNTMLAQANVRSAELVAELQARREELEWTNANLKQAHEERKRILSIAAHDLRSGIGGIRGLSEILCEELANSSSEVCEQAQLIHRESARLLDLLEDILDESRAQMGKLELRRRRMRLTDILGESVEVQRRACSAKGQTIEICSRCGDQDVEADPVRLRQALDNLLSNAGKYGPPDSAIRVEVWEENAQIVIAVVDEGPGLQAADFDKAFKEFSRLSAQPTAGEPSHGLGLAIVKKIVEQHNGRVWVENRTDRSGARFCMMLPSANVTQVAHRILVVDDRAMNRLIMKRLLERAGHEVEAADDGEEAVRAASHGSFDLVFMDVEMPGMDGLAATRAIRARGRGDEVLPIIALTGHTDPSLLATCFDAGMNDTLCKPVDPAQLSEIVRKWAIGRESRARAA